MTRPTSSTRESCYRAVKSRTSGSTGLYTTVRTTGIYCRPLARRDAGVANVDVPSSAAAARRRLPRLQALPPRRDTRQPDWDVAADRGRAAMRLIADGVVDREGVGGLAHALGLTTRHLTRLLTAELGAGPLALARRAAQTARVLIETTELTYADIAFASGFSSVRQFNDTIREVYAVRPPTSGVAQPPWPTTGTVTMRLAVRTPYAGAPLLDFLATRAIPGVEASGDGGTRTPRLPHGTGTVRLEIPDVPSRRADGVRDRDVRARGPPRHLGGSRARPPAARRRLRPDRGRDAFAGDPLIGPLVRRTPGPRVPGHVDGDEVAVRAVLGQQVSVTGARTVAARLARRARPGARPAGRRAHPPVPRRRDDRRRSTPRTLPHAALARSGAGDAVRRARRGHASRSTAAATATTYAGRCSRCRASVRGRPATSRCERSATPTCSCRPTSASATPSPGSARTRRAPPTSPSAGGRGVVRPACTSWQTLGRAEGELTCGP